MEKKYLMEFIKVLNEIKLLNKNVFFMTNAPRRSKVIEKQLSAFGLNRDLYECVISSGEITWQSLKKKSYKFCYIIWSRKRSSPIEGLDYEVCKDYDNVEIIINTGPGGLKISLKITNQFLKVL